MKILHTADWHLGKKIDRFSRIEEQCLVMEEIVQIADQHKVDAVIIAGDLFDNFTPNIEAIELFYKTLKRLSLGGVRPVIAIAGNHDAPKLIDAPDPLARECGIILIGYPNAIVKNTDSSYFRIPFSKEGFFEITFSQYNYPLRIIHTPYADESRICDTKGVNILTAHLFMNPRGGEVLEEPEGERPIKIGNADMIYTDIIPPQIQYTALGHLHGFKNIGSKEKPIVYASSPLCYSFSEAGQQKYVVIIEAEPNREIKLEKIPLKNGKALVRKTFDSINKATNWLEGNPDTWVELTIEMEQFLKKEEQNQLYNVHQGIVYLIPKLKYKDDTKYTYQLVQQDINFENVIPLFENYFKYKNGGISPNKEILELFNEILTIE